MSTKAYMITDKKNDTVGLISKIDENNVKVTWQSETAELVREDEFSLEDLESLLSSDEYEVSEVDVEDTISEDAADTIKAHSTASAPGSQADGNPKTRLEYMLKVIDGLGEMDLETLVKHYNDQQANIGGEAARAGVDGNAEKNAASIKAKPTVATEDFRLSAEDQDSLFKESSLSDEAKIKMTALFEEAVAIRVATEVVKLQEASTASIEKNVTEITTSINDVLDVYLEEVVEKYLKDNEVAVESTLRTELTNEFIDKLKVLFTESYIDIPEDKVDVLEAVVIENEDLKEKVNSVMTESLDKSKSIKSLEKTIAILESSEGLTLPQKTRFSKLTESVEFTDTESFKKSIAVLKETVKETPVESNILKEGLDETTEVTTPAVDSSIASIAKRMSRTGKNS